MYKGAATWQAGGPGLQSAVASRQAGTGRISGREREKAERPERSCECWQSNSPKHKGQAMWALLLPPTAREGGRQGEAL